MSPLPILIDVVFRDRLIATIRAARPVLESPGALVVGSEVPNLLEAGAAATLVVSQDLDVGVPVDRHASLKQRLGDLREFLSLLAPRSGMPDPQPRRAEVAALLRRLEQGDPEVA